MIELGITAEAALALYKQARVRRVFPARFLQNKLEEIEAAARGRDRDARTALKLLFDSRFDK